MLSRGLNLLAGAMTLAGVLHVRSAGAMNLSESFAKCGYEAIELRRTGENHLFLFGQVNGRKRSCLVDTGWSFTTAATNVLRGMGDAGWIAHLKLGRVAFTNQPVVMQRMVFNGQPASFDVVLGLDFLRENFAVIDCGSRRLYPRRAAPDEAEQKILEAAIRRAGFREVELQLKRPPALTVRALVNREPVEMLVDSGAVWSCLDARQSERLRFQPAPSAARITGAGATGTRPVAAAEVQSFQIGGVMMKGMTLAVFDLSDWGLAAPGRTLAEVQGILGGDALAAGEALIDCHALKLWLKSAAR